MTSKFMSDPIRILVKRDELTLEGIKQFFVGECKMQKYVMLLLFARLWITLSIHNSFNQFTDWYLYL